MLKNFLNIFSLLILVSSFIFLCQAYIPGRSSSVGTGSFLHIPVISLSPDSGRLWPDNSYQIQLETSKHRNQLQSGCIEINGTSRSSYNRDPVGFRWIISTIFFGSFPVATHWKPEEPRRNWSNLCKNIYQIITARKPPENKQCTADRARVTCD